MVRILGFSGKKESGKSTASNFIHGYQLRAFNIIDNFAITHNGELLVETHNEKKEAIHNKLDIFRRDEEFAEWAGYNMWPYVRNYSFATPLKSIAIELFGLTHEQVYGTDEQKNSPTHLFWENMPGITSCGLKISSQMARSKSGQKFEELAKDVTYHKPGVMTAREFLQFFGTEICRKIHEDIWTEYLINTINQEGSLLAVVDDVRFENEVEAIKEAGGKVIRLMRDVHEDGHGSETELDNYKHFDGLINNNETDITETCHQIIGLLEEWGWLTERPKPEVSGVTTVKSGA